MYGPEVAEALLLIEKELRQLGLWSSSSPSPEQLQSTMPFSVDTLTFPEWLQFIFLPNMKILVEGGAELPFACNIKPVALDYVESEQLQADLLLSAIDEMDRLLSGPAH